MAEIIKETITTQNESENVIVATPVQAVEAVSNTTQMVTTTTPTSEYLIYFFIGALEILLGFRLLLKIMGASISSSFVSMIYGLSGLFILPFEGIFRRGFTQGIETTAVLEPATIVAMLVYAIMVWGIIKLLRIFTQK